MLGGHAKCDLHWPAPRAAPDRGAAARSSHWVRKNYERRAKKKMKKKRYTPAKCSVQMHLRFPLARNCTTTASTLQSQAALPIAILSMRLRGFPYLHRVSTSPYDPAYGPPRRCYSFQRSACCPHCWSCPDSDADSVSIQGTIGKPPTENGFYDGHPSSFLSESFFFAHVIFLFPRADSVAK